MTRQEYIDAVKVKLEEISPFNEPDHFIAAAGDSNYTKVKPIVSYIERTLDEAAHNMLRSLPLTLLHADIEITTPNMNIDSLGVGFIRVSPQQRFVRLHHPALQRDITAFITTEDPLYLLQQNRYTRGGTAKPVAVFASNVVTGLTGNTGQLEIYSFPSDMETTQGQADGNAVLYLINTEKHPESDHTNRVLSPIEEYVVLECAAMVADIMENAAAAQACRAEQQRKIQSLLQ